MSALRTDSGKAKTAIPVRREASAVRFSESSTWISPKTKLLASPELVESAGLKLVPAINEELAATAIWGSQVEIPGRARGVAAFAGDENPVHSGHPAGVAKIPHQGIDARLEGGNIAECRDVDGCVKSLALTDKFSDILIRWIHRHDVGRGSR